MRKWSAVVLFLMSMALPSFARHLASSDPQWGSYPREALRAGIQGEVVLLIVVAPSGKIRSVQAVHSDVAMLADAATKVMKKNRFRPVNVRRTDEVVAFTFTYEIDSKTREEVVKFDDRNGVNMVQYFAPPPLQLREALFPGPQ